MRNYIILFAAFFLLQSCDNENAWDCVQTVGDMVEVPVEVAPFTRVTVEDDIFLDIKQGDSHQVIVHTGSNLLDDISVVVEADGNLRLKNLNKCNFTRAYDVTRITVTTPTLTHIRSASRNPVTSLNQLHFENLELTSNTNVGVIDEGKSGNFILDVVVDRLTVSANGFSLFDISGIAENATILFSDEIPRFEGEDLIIQHLNVFHAAGNDMIVHPIQSIKGVVRGIGDVISLNRPPEVDVSVTNVGQLLFP
ncbi:hypothetical protein SCB49_09040 [unidentified eubacterium SCB49]|nr:hypothetical protein SCB49_09040 [unidentified eubacterium SCB49]